jgi:glycosyltransferase involved in cell wall biosynthesis
VGEVGGEDKAELLGGATALLNPIRWPEPFGLVMVEALACGTPVLASPRGAAPEIVEQGVTGLLDWTPETIASAVEEVASLDRYDCRRAAERRFTTRRMVDEHLDLFRDLVAGDPGRVSDRGEAISAA